MAPHSPAPRKTSEQSVPNGLARLEEADPSAPGQRTVQPGMGNSSWRTCPHWQPLIFRPQTPQSRCFRRPLAQLLCQTPGLCCAEPALTVPASLDLQGPGWPQ